jgi:hypothetical protein
MMVYGGKGAICLGDGWFVCIVVEFFCVSLIPFLPQMTGRRREGWMNGREVVWL